MGYIGVQPKAGFTSGLLDRFTSTTGTTVTLTHDIASENDIIVFVNFVKQDSTNYSVGGTGNKTLTLGGTLVSSDVVEVHYINAVKLTQAPSAGSVGISELNVSDGSSGQALTTNGSGTLSFATVGGTNTPAFHAYVDSNQSISNATDTKPAFDTEIYDTDNAYDSSSTYRFTPQTAGKYFIYTQVYFDTGANNNNVDYAYIEIKKSGTVIIDTMFDFRDDRDGRKFAIKSSTVADMNGSSDYIEVFGSMSANQTGDLRFAGNSTSNKTHFGAFRIIT
tara:strand:- start:3369 stop:4202 length:834 start_codon:yes stop_codon:yes gene_type:complete